MLSKLFQRLFSSGSHQMMPRLRDDPLYNYRETWLVGVIAFKDALAVGQALSLAHVLGAALYRLRDADPKLAARLAISFLSVRQWTMRNLPSPLLRFPLESSLDHEYTVYVQEYSGSYRLKVDSVNRPVRALMGRGAESVDAGERPHGVGRFTKISQDSSSKDGLERVFKLLDSCEDFGETPELTFITLQRILAKLLDDQQVQDCLAAHGVTPQELLTDLGMSSG